MGKKHFQLNYIGIFIISFVFLGAGIVILVQYGNQEFSIVPWIAIGAGTLALFVGINNVVTAIRHKKIKADGVPSQAVIKNISTYSYNQSSTGLVSMMMYRITFTFQDENMNPCTGKQDIEYKYGYYFKEGASIPILVLNKHAIFDESRFVPPTDVPPRPDIY